MTELRDVLYEAYKFIVRSGYVVSYEEVGDHLVEQAIMDPDTRLVQGKSSMALIRQLEKDNLIHYSSLNGDQGFKSDFDIDNENPAETEIASDREFNRIYRPGQVVEKPQPKGRAKREPRASLSTEDLEDCVRLRGEGYSWKDIAYIVLGRESQSAGYQLASKVKKIHGDV